MAAEQSYQSARPLVSETEASLGGRSGLLDGSSEARFPRRRWPRVIGIFQQDWAPGILFMLLDVICWLGIHGIVSSVRGDTLLQAPLETALLDVIQVTVLVMALFVIGGYDWHVEMRSLAYTTEHLFAVASAAVLIALLIYGAATYAQTMNPSRGALLLSFVAFAPLSLAYRRFVRHFVAATTGNRTFLVIGIGEAAVRFYHSYKASPNRQQLEFVGLDEVRVGAPIAGPASPLIGGNLEGRLADLGNRYSGIILAENPKRLTNALVERLVRTQFQDTRVYTLESFYETFWRYVPLGAIDPVWPLQSGFQLARISPYHYLKRLCDILASIGAMIVFAPIFVVAVGLIWLESGRPVLYQQVRVGRGGRDFTLFKLRTMVVRANEESDDIYTRRGDSRITRVGRWLRKFRLDEIPQLWNVFQGDMSLIGPRAEWVKCAERYEKQIPFYHFRHLVKPGITGWAQVNYPYGESDKDAIEKLKFDLYYIRHYSLKLDAMIALKTLYVMLFSKGQ